MVVVGTPPTTWRPFTCGRPRRWESLERRGERRFISCSIMASCLERRFFLEEWPVRFSSLPTLLFRLTLRRCVRRRHVSLALFPSLERPRLPAHRGFPTLWCIKVEQVATYGSNAVESGTIPGKFDVRNTTILLFRWHGSWRSRGR